METQALQHHTDDASNLTPDGLVVDLSRAGAGDGVEGEAWLPDHLGKGDRVRWRVWPAGERPGACALAVIVIVALGVAVGVGFENWLWSAFAIVVLAISLQRFFLPSTFELTDSGVIAHLGLIRRDMPWERIRRVEFSGDGQGRAGVLSTRARPTRMDRWQALHIALPPMEHGQAIRGLIDKSVQQARQHAQTAPIHQQAATADKVSRSHEQQKRRITSTKVQLEEPLLAQQQQRINRSGGRGLGA